MTCKYRILRLIALALVLAGMPRSAEAASGSSPDWPCIQREVPEISAGMVWPGDPVDAEDTSWTQDQDVANVVQRLTSRRNSIEDALKIVDDFAAGLKENRVQKLRAAFVGTLQRINAERRQIMGGIKRYARRQAALADQIKTKSLEEASLSRQSPLTDENRRRIGELREEIEWDTRIYEERERSLTYVCETPVLLEQRLFQIGRHVAELIGK